MSFVDLATLALHRRNEMEARINAFSSKCDRAIKDIKKLKMLAQGFTEHLNCEPGELKERFLNSMKQLDEYTYLITDFNLAISNLEGYNSMELAPVHDTSVRPLPSPSPCGAFNLMDALTEKSPSTSKTCQNQCATEKPIRKKVEKKDQILIAFSSTSNSSESISRSKVDNTSEKKVQGKIADEVMNKLNKDIGQKNEFTNCNLPAQTILQTDHAYPATILNVDGTSFWVTTEEAILLYELVAEMTKFYNNNFVKLTLEDVMLLTCCASYDDETDSYYRCLFIRIVEEGLAQVFLVDTGAFLIIPIVNIQPLAKRFSTTPPYARCCHLAGVDFISNNNDNCSKNFEEFLKAYTGMPCTIEVDDNTSESLGVYVTFEEAHNKTVLNTLLIEQGLAQAIERLNITEERAMPVTVKGPPEILQSGEIDITDCPEYDDPVEAVAGYHNRDEVDICKHYKGGPEKTCFKGARCTKRHVLKHPDGWTLDRVPVTGKCRWLPLPAPGTWLDVYVTHVAHYDRLYVQLIQPHREEQIPSFGVVLPPTTLERLVNDMNSPAARMSYKPLKIAPAPGELVAALYPQDDQWYRARVLCSNRVEQNVEVMYIDYGNVVWVKEDSVRELDPRYWSLEAQAIRCKLAGVTAKSATSGQWAAAKALLQRLVQEGGIFRAHVIARDYDEIEVALFDDRGKNVAEQMAASQLVEFTEYLVQSDNGIKQNGIKVCAP